MLDAGVAGPENESSVKAGSLIAAISIAAIVIVLALLSLNRAHYTTRTLATGSGWVAYDRDSVLRVLSLNIHAGLDALGNDRVDDIARLISDFEPDLVSLQEVRRNDPATRRVLQDVTLSSNSGMVALFQPLVWLLGTTQGNAVLSRTYPEAENSLTLSGGRERRGILLVSVKLGEVEVDFINVHFGLSVSERSTQIRALVDLLQQRGNPAIIAGDFNVEPHSAELLPLAAIAREAWDAALVRHDSGMTFPASNPRVRIDQIWVHGPLEVLETGVIRSDVSDHLPIYASIRLQPLL
jgi:endonuclease/exonuclease/phosphatase family metal-dependent hydrolase